MYLNRILIGLISFFLHFVEHVSRFFSVSFCNALTSGSYRENLCNNIEEEIRSDPLQKITGSLEYVLLGWLF